MSITPQAALQRVIEHREIFHDEMVALMRATGLIVSPLMKFLSSIFMDAHQHPEPRLAQRVLPQRTQKTLVHQRLHRVDRPWSIVKRLQIDHGDGQEEPRFHSYQQCVQGPPELALRQPRQPKRGNVDQSCPPATAPVCASCACHERTATIDDAPGNCAEQQQDE